MLQGTEGACLLPSLPSPSVRCSRMLSRPAGTTGQSRGILSQFGTTQLLHSPQGWGEVSPAEGQPSEASVTGPVSRMPGRYPHRSTSARFGWRAQLHSSWLPLQSSASAHSIQPEHPWPSSTQVTQRSGKNSRFVGLWATAQSSEEKMEQEYFRKGDKGSLLLDVSDLWHFHTGFEFHRMLFGQTHASEVELWP